MLLLFQVEAAMLGLAHTGPIHNPRI